MAIPDVIPLLGVSWDDILFITFAAVMLGSALLVVTMRDIIRAGLAMIVSFLALAGIYVLVGAAIVGAAQVLVYVGAISVLILFAIMLTQSKAGPARLVFQTQAVAAAVASIVLALLLAFVVTATDWGAVADRISATTNDVARALFDTYVLPFEIVSVLLLAAVIGGVFLARRDPETPS